MSVDPAALAETVPEEIQQLAASLGVDIPTLLAANPQLAEQVAAASAPAPAAAPSAAAAAVPVAIPAAGSSVASTPEAGATTEVAPGTTVGEGVTPVPAETPQQTLERLLAVQTQENAQLRQSMQTLQAGRVVGSAGLSGPVVETPPNLGGVEPGLRWAVRNGFVKVEDIADKLIQDLFKNDIGGVI
jgi:hypothetical protein